MQNYLFRIIALALLASGPAAIGTTLFEEGFEQGLTAWTVTTTNQGRALASTDHGPAGGTHHLVLDDAVNDSTYSVAEATISLDLSFKKNVVLQFKAKSLGNESNPPPAENFTTARNHDAVAISTDGGTTWRGLQSLAAIGTTWTTYAIPLDAAITQLGGNLVPDCRIRFSGYDNAPAPLDGIAIDDVSLTAEPDQRAIVEMSGPVNEGGGPYTGSVMLFSAPDAPLTLALLTGAGSPLMLPPAVTVPAGATSASFQYTVEEDAVITLTRTVSVDAYAAGVVATPGSVTVIDNDVPVVSLTLPATLKEGESPTDNATLSFDPAPSVPLVLELTAIPANELILPTTVTLPAGQNQVSFTARATNDTRIDGDISVVVTVSAAGMAPVSAATTVSDNETRALVLTVPATIKEGANGNASVSLSGVLPDPLVVSLAPGSGADITIPSSVTIPAGSTSVGFTIGTAENAERDGTRTLSLEATADGFSAATKNIVVKDNDISSYRFSAFTDVMNLGVATLMTIQPVDIEGTVIMGLSGTVNLALVLADGSTQPVTPASVNFTNSTWTGSVTMPAIHGTGLRLRASDVGGYSGISTPFDAMRTLTMKASDLVWNPARNVIYASVGASDTTAHANKVVAIDPVTLQVTGSTATGQDPRRLALTADGQYLYVSLFGNGRIGKIDTVTMQLISSLAMGSDGIYGTLYAEDMCLVAGQPDTLIVSQAGKSSNRHVAVAVFDSGIQRPQKASYGSSNEIEPTADPAIYVGQETGSTLFETSKLQLRADGMTRLATRKSVIEDSTTNFQSQGDTIFAGNGKVVDATTLEPTGTFPTSGPMWAELAANRVYFLEGDSIFGNYSKIAAFDPATYALVRRMSMPSISNSGGGTLIRWGSNGLAFRSDTTVRILSSSLTVSGAPADLQVNLEARPDPVAVGVPVTYTVQVTNQGPNPAMGVELTATLSTDQTLNHTTADLGTAVVGSVVKLAAGDLAAGASVTLTLTATPLVAGNPSCQVMANSRTVDPDGTNNVDIQFARVGYQPGPDSINTLRLAAKSMIYDAGRGLLWCTIPSSEAAPLGKSVVSIDPATGAISAPIPLGANPMENSIALSGNGRYLYVGLSDIRHLCRIDLQANPPAIVVVPLEVDDNGSTGFATDIEVLEGDGKSVVVCTTGGFDEVNIIDDLTRRDAGNRSISADTIEPAGMPGVFIAFDTTSSNPRYWLLQVTPTGLTVLEDRWNVLDGPARRIHGNGGTVLASNGYLVDGSNLALKLNLGSSGSPWLDGAKNRAYLVNGNMLRGFDTTTGLPAASLALPTTATGDWSLSCTRWGADGIAILGGEGKIHVLRWSELGGSMDEDQDGVSDAWENNYFGSLDSNLAADVDHDGLSSVIEYLFGSSPEESSMNPLLTSISGIPDAPTLVLEFPRRSGLANSYRIQTSADLENWTNAAEVVETVIAIQTVGGVTTETVRAQIPMTDGLHFARIKWVGL